MNGFQRITAALKGERPDVTPVMLHNFMPAARETGVTMAEYRRDPEIIARCFTRSVEQYGLDGILVDVDTATLAGALGVPVDYPEDEPALCRGGRLQSLEAVKDLEPVDVRRHIPVQVWLEAVTRLRRHFGDEVFIRGNCDQCPFSLASMMRSAEGWMVDLMEEANRELAHGLLRYCAEATTQFLRLMAEAGAHMVSNGDSPAGPALISPRLYREFAFPYEKLAAASAHKLGLPYALHICGDTDLILEDMVATGADALELDHKTGLHRAAAIMKDRTALIGNLDPNGVLALGSPALVAQRTRELLECFRDNPRFILNAGCALPATTPPENIRSMLRAARGG